MKKIFTVLVYALTFATPAMIVQYYNHFVSPMSSDEVRMSTITGTVAMLILAALTGFSGKRPSMKNASRRMKSTKAVGPGEIVIKDPGSGAETLFKWNEKEGLWETDYGTYLDEDHMDQWLRQRSSDRAWVNDQMKKLRERRTSFDREIDRMGKK